MKWVLIWIVASTSIQGGIATSSVEFNNETDCRLAEVTLSAANTKVNGAYKRLVTICALKTPDRGE